MELGVVDGEEFALMERMKILKPDRGLVCCGLWSVGAEGIADLKG